MLLRAKPGEFKSEPSLKKQIAQKEGVKWDVMRTRLNISKSYKK
ncbi:MAG: hypothetical protein ABIB43_04165 [archaeon]